jgi:hypothetical protein
MDHTIRVEDLGNGSWQADKGRCAMGEVVSIPGSREVFIVKSPQEREAFDRLQRCDECDEWAAWGDLDAGVAFCEEHNPWTDKALGSRVQEATEPGRFRRWLEALPNEGAMPRRDGSCGPLREYLHEVVGTDLLVYPPVVQLADGSFGPVVHLPTWTKRFDDMLMWVEEEDGSTKEECLNVLTKAMELDEVGQQGHGMEAKAREYEVLPPEVQTALLDAASGGRRRRGSWWGRLLGR